MPAAEVAVTVFNILLKYGPAAYKIACDILQKDKPTAEDYMVLYLAVKKYEDYVPVPVDPAK